MAEESQAEAGGRTWRENDTRHFECPACDWIGDIYETLFTYVRGSEEMPNGRRDHAHFCPECETPIVANRMTPEGNGYKHYWTKLDNEKPADSFYKYNEDTDSWNGV